jgi:hypothetical protein
MIAITARKIFQVRADRRADRVRLRKFEDIFRSADAQAEENMMRPKPSPAFRRFFMPIGMAYARRLATAEARMDPSWPSASGARLTLLL